MTTVPGNMDASAYGEMSHFGGKVGMKARLAYCQKT